MDLAYTYFPVCENIFKDKVVCITGELLKFGRGREAAAKAISLVGGIPKLSKVTKKTEILIVGDYFGEQKLKDAYKLKESGQNIEIVSDLCLYAVLIQENVWHNYFYLDKK